MIFRLYKPATWKPVIWKPVTWKRALASSAIALSLASGLVSCSAAKETQPADTAAEVESGANPSEQAASPETEADTEEAARAEWEAQMAKIQGVFEGMDRSEIIADASTKGPLDAEVVLLKFSDFQCPYCAIASADMKVFTRNNESDVLYVYKQLPLESIHPEALPAAKASWAAGQQDQFWLYHDGLFAFQDRLGEDYYVELAEQIGLDVEQFNRDRKSPEAQAAIDKDVELAKDLGIRGTPTFLMNELLIPGGAPLDFFEEAARRLKAGESLN